MSNIIDSKTYLIGSLGGGVTKVSIPIGNNEEFATNAGGLNCRKK